MARQVLAPRPQTATVVVRSERAVIEAQEYPLLGFARFGRSHPHMFMIRDAEELREAPLHSYVSGALNAQLFFSLSGKKYAAKRPKIAGICWRRIKSVGVGASLFSAIFSLFNIPVVLSFDVDLAGPASVAELKALAISALAGDGPFALRGTRRKIALGKIRKAKETEEVFDALKDI